MLNLDEWEHIVQGVDKSSVPVECIRKLIVRMDGRKQKTINVQALRRKGLESEDIEKIIHFQLTELGDSVIAVDFFIDVDSVAEIIQPATDNLLNKL